jgi:hypothetical protein
MFAAVFKTPRNKCRDWGCGLEINMSRAVTFVSQMGGGTRAIRLSSAFHSYLSWGKCYKILASPIARAQ